TENLTTQIRKIKQQANALDHVASQNKKPAPIDHPKKCQSCSLQRICLPFEDKKLHVQLQCQ
ncbi:MAG: CRISPR-associated protein Cas4, partial [Dolichospermum sp.]